MRFLCAVATISVLALALAGSTLAQGSASHHVSVSIPTVLRLRIDHQVASDHASVPVSVHVEGARRTIDPAATRVEVLANTAWQLSVSYTPGAGGSGLVLSWHALGGSGVLRASPSLLGADRATGGWRPIDVTYGVVNHPADGHYQGVIAYTLARP